ncbi:MAG TPA: flippase activity-associated protein Agl23, partial [Dehalococcoidia bacterium]|nr:flippase activity-associated protein Agl23 [Dehalococcoidia bacterium]
MTELAEPIPLGVPQDGLLARLVSVRVQVNRELVAYASLILVAAGFRFWDLGARALHHDESLHSWTAWKLFEGQGYQHEPWMHGPFQFFSTAFGFFLFGDSDYTARIVPAIFGSALVVLPFLLRHRLGNLGALLAAAGIAFSPTLLYFSRFPHNEIYIAFFTLGLIACFWRYVADQKPLYLYAAALLLGLSFATKVSTFINAMALIAFIDGWMAVHFWRQLRTRNRLDSAGSALLLAALIPFAWALVALWPFTSRWRQRVGLTDWHPAADFLLLIGTLTAPQFAAAIQKPLAAIGISEADLAHPMGDVTRENVLGFFTIATLVAAAAVVGLRWNAAVWPLAAAAFYVPYAALYTSFFTDLDGFYSGHWGALDYWLGQQNVARGEQPWFYYLMLLPVYEFLPLVFAAPALFLYALKGDVFRRFLVFWAVATFFGYSWAGEKMPWLSVNTAL